jgi:hypothetical protein
MRHIIPLLLLAGVATPALAQQDTNYIDDRSTPEAVIRSYYNAVNRHEYVRAYSYYQDGEGVADFDTFAAGYKDTAVVNVTVGKASSEGAAGSTYYSVPVTIDAMDIHGKHSLFAGCFTLRLANPAIQAEPPFEPMHITAGSLKKASGGGPRYLPKSCD